MGIFGFFFIMLMYLAIMSGIVTCWRMASSGVSRKPKWSRLTKRRVVLAPTPSSNPLVGAMLNRMTQSCLSISWP